MNWEGTTLYSEEEANVQPCEPFHGVIHVQDTSVPCYQRRLLRMYRVASVCFGWYSLYLITAVSCALVHRPHPYHCPFLRIAYTIMKQNKKRFNMMKYFCLGYCNHSVTCRDLCISDISCVQYMRGIFSWEYIAAALESVELSQFAPTQDLALTLLAGIELIADIFELLEDYWLTKDACRNMFYGTS